MVPRLVHKLQKIQLLIVGQSLGLIYESAVVVGAAAHRQGHASGGFAGCDRLYPLRNLVASTIELASELSDQGSGLIFIRPLEGSPGHNRNDPRDCAHGKKNRQREHQQKFAAKAQGFSVPSQTFCNCQPPSRSSVQPLTFAPSATAVRKCSKGITRCDCSKSAFGGIKAGRRIAVELRLRQSQLRRKTAERNLGVERSQRNSHQPHLGSAGVRRFATAARHRARSARFSPQ